MKAISTFDVTGWDETTYDEPSDGPRLSRATIRKKFEGDLEAESTAEALFCVGEDYSAGAGYIASERVTGRLGGRNGTFVIQHGGLSGGTGGERTYGHIVPGSGTGELVGLGGTATISRAADGSHTLTMDYHFIDDSAE